MKLSDDVLMTIIVCATVIITLVIICTFAVCFG